MNQPSFGYPQQQQAMQQQQQPQQQPPWPPQAQAQAQALPLAPMSAAVVVAIAAISLEFLFVSAAKVLEIVSGRASLDGSLVNIALSVLIVVGLVKRNRLAWQWGRVAGVLMLIYSLVTWWHASLAYDVGRGIMMFLILASVVALSMPSAKRFFRLVCPACGKTSTSANDFLFLKAKCKSCKNVW